MPFGLKTRVGPGNHVLDEVQIPMGRRHLGGGERRVVPLLSIGTLCGHLCKTAEPIEVPFLVEGSDGPKES